MPTEGRGGESLEHVSTLKIQGFIEGDSVTYLTAILALLVLHYTTFALRSA